MTISRYKEIGKNLVVGEYSEIRQLLSKYQNAKAKIELYVAPVDSDDNDATSVVPTGAILRFPVRCRSIYRMFTAIEQKIESHLGETFFSNEIPEFPPKIITKLSHSCQFFNNNERQSRSVRKTCYPFLSYHLATFEGKEFREYLSRIFLITSSKLSK